MCTLIMKVKKHHKLESSPKELKPTFAKAYDVLMYLITNPSQF